MNSSRDILYHTLNWSLSSIHLSGMNSLLFLTQVSILDMVW